MRNIIVLRAIRQTVLSHLPGSRILLFGSHARGDDDKGSDYDLLVITRETLTSQEKISLSTRLDKAIVANINVPCDLLINSEAEVLQKKEMPGHIVRSAMKEGIFL